MNDFRAEILHLKKERRAVILAHYYQESEIQDLADFLGDSLALAQAAQRTDADVIAFCGVHFMAETAKILNPERTVVIPDLNAGCSLAASCPAPLLAQWKQEHPDHKIISYINCTAEVKALSDIICTSSNAKKVVESFPQDQKLLFAPDKNLGEWLIDQTGRHMDLWPGACHVHVAFHAEKILESKLAHPNALFICHPECEENVRFHADYIGSTSALLKFIEENTATAFIVGTEPGIIHQMKKKAPHKTYIEAPFAAERACACNACPYMKLNTLEKLHACLETLSPQIEMNEELRHRASLPLKRMLALA
ncbi:MAG: quinolinate synthase NadA [Deltaproteobacteria bacterium]|nr:quinolinate synthase NadA [Deltaproteobacteria bacterium]